MSLHPQQRLLIRADAAYEIGTGHVMRCLALAHAWQAAGGQCSFAMSWSISGLEKRLEADGCTVHRSEPPADLAADALHTATLAKEIDAHWIVVDGYRFDSPYIESLRRHGFRVLLIDDEGRLPHYTADVVLNQNLQAAPSLYAHRSAHTRLLLGTQYTMLRKEFYPYRGIRRETSAIGRKVLITMGGSDPLNVTPLAIEAVRLLEHGQVEARIIVGGGNPRHTELVASVSDTPNFHIVHDVVDMTPHLEWADAAITGAGSTCWELALIGVPMLTVVLADNQWPIAAALSEAEAGVNLGRAETLSSAAIAAQLHVILPDADLRARMRHNAQTVVDGFGGDRVVAALRTDPP